MLDAAMRAVQRITLLVSLAAVLFALFFQINKSGPLRQVSPFVEDPYDAVGSMAVQAALLVALLSFARVVRWQSDPSQAPKMRLILRGNALVLGCMWVTLVADAIAVVLTPPPHSAWGSLLLGELALMILFAIVCSVGLARILMRVQCPPAPRDLTLADSIDDVWALARRATAKCGALLPNRWVTWVDGFGSDGLFAKVPWLNPRVHTWRFAIVLGLAVGIGLYLTQLREGLPPNLLSGLLVAGIFVSVELGATLLGLALLGGFLGLRPTR